MDRPTQRWEPDRSAAQQASLPSYLTMLGRGAVNRCPVCGQGKVFQGFLRLVPECSHCHTRLGGLRADDAPPYFVIFIVGHLLLPPVFWVESTYQPPMWVHMAIWLPLFTIACTLMLRPVKGAVVGWMLKLGFTGEDHDMPALPLTGPRDHPGSSGPNSSGPKDG
ncbi:MAG TPA: DUF983 domain-containing protein [Roseomonas sp.]|nr:DUF983 domain-containing protein [Roseomonas sp.]